MPLQSFADCAGGEREHVVFFRCVLYYDDSFLFGISVCGTYRCMMMFFDTANQKYAKKASPDFIRSIWFHDMEGAAVP